MWLPAESANKSGRAIAGMTIRNRRSIKTRHMTVNAKDWIMSVDIKIDDRWLTLIGVYNRKGMNRKIIKCIQDLVDKNQTMTIIEGK